MGCIASACASCCGSCIGSSICACCPSCCPTKTQSRVPYLVITALVTALALIMRYWGSGWVINLFVTSFEVCPTEKCVGQEAVYRLSAALCCFFAAHLFAIYFSNSATPHTSWWPAKILFLAVLCVVFFLIPNGPFDVYAIIARFVSGFFLLIQIMILIDFAHKWNKAWIADDKEWFWPLAGSTFALFGASVVVCVFLFIWFTNGGTSECRLETFFIVFTICLTVIVTILSLLVPWGSLLPSAVVSLYCFYLTYSALTSDPSSCNTLQTQTTAQVIIGILIACFTVCYAGWNISNEPNLFGVDTPEEQAAQVSNSPSNSYQQPKDVENPKDKDLSPSAAQDEKDEKAEEDAQLDEEQKSQLVKFHFVMAVVSMYVAMLLTSWGSQTGTSGASYDLSEVAMWIKIVSCWVTILLYSWTILAPKLFPDRDFGVEMPHD